MFSVSGNMRQRDVYFQKKKKRIKLNKEKKRRRRKIEEEEKDKRKGKCVQLEREGKIEKRARWEADKQETEI